MSRAVAPLRGGVACGRHPGWRRSLPGGGQPGDDGFTLIELIIAMAIGMVVLGLTLISLTVSIRTGYSGVAMGQANDKANLAFTELRRQVSAADIVFNPATEGTNAGATIPTGFSLRILTDQSGTTTCVQWRLIDTAATGTLQVRSWPDGEPTQVTAWVPVVAGIVNPATTPPFALATTTAYGNRLLDVDLVVKAANTRASPVTTQIRSSFAAFNAQFFAGTHSAFCSPVPAP